MKKICVVTATRAEYGALKRVIDRIIEDSELNLSLVVTGTHLSENYGYTIDEIIEDSIPISAKIDILNEPLDEENICNTMSNAARLFGEYFKNEHPDLIIVVGDRYELLPICGSALIFGIPIAHISGGEITEGAIDDIVRHSVTKMSTLHFPANEEYRKRIIQLGEEPERVFNFGDIGVENVIKTDFLSKEELASQLNIDLDKPFAVVTFHPVTREKNSEEEQALELIEAMKSKSGINFIVTMANADLGGDKINELLRYAEQNVDNIFLFSSLGAKRYLSLVKYSEFVLGNSSSGIIEAPSLGKPTINIGNRQKGRLRTESVIDCAPEKTDILKAIEKAQSKEFKEFAKYVENPYGNGETSQNIVRVIKEFLSEDSAGLNKKFYNIDFELSE